MSEGAKFIDCNSPGTVHIDSKDETVQQFAEVHSKRLESMLHVLMENHQEIEGYFMYDMLRIAQDIAYQLQQAVALIGKTASSEVTHV